MMESDGERQNATKSAGKCRKAMKSKGKQRRATQSNGEHPKGMASNGGDQNLFDFLPPRRRGFLVAGARLFFFGSKGSVER
jgi:hypothetical protein